MNWLKKLLPKKTKFKPSEILSKVQYATNARIFKEFGDDLVNVSTRTLQVFKMKGCTCSKCRSVGQYFKLDTAYNVKVLRLYTIKDGREVLMTKDHIIPKSKGGTNKLENFQTMCFECNSNKGNKNDQKVIDGRLL